MASLLIRTSTRAMNGSLLGNVWNRTITLSAANNLKQIELKQEKDVLTIRGSYKPSDREPLIVNELRDCQKENKHFCPECTLGLDVKHTDVLIISQYVRDDGCMMPRRVTGLCRKQQKRMGSLVTMAQKAGLMPNLAPAWSKKDPKKRYGFKKFNRYFEEDTIKC